jgi:hypothetical protein
MSFEVDILQSRGGRIRKTSRSYIHYVIFENIAAQLDVDTAKHTDMINRLSDVAQMLQDNPCDVRLLYEYHRLYYGMAVWHNYRDDDFSSDVLLPAVLMPDRISNLIARRNQILRELYEAAATIPPATPADKPRKIKRLTLDDMKPALTPDTVDDEKAKMYGYGSAYIYRLHDSLYGLSTDWRKTEDERFLHEYHYTLYKLILLGYDIGDMYVLAEIDSMDVPAYYNDYHKS